MSDTNDMALQSFRLVHVETGQIESYSLGSSPLYVAVSHTWADALFPPGQRFRQMKGWKHIKSLVSSHYSYINHCWIDTLCIDQNDPDDKQRQIPLMGEIYGNAELVAITVMEPLVITQAKMDAVAESVEGAVQMSLNGSFIEDGQAWTSREKRRLLLVEAMDCLEIFTRSAWGERVWTMQEFILAKQTVWIGRERLPVRVDERLFQAIPDVCDQLSIDECLVPKYQKLYQHFQGMAGAHLKMIDPTRVMELLGNKRATVPEDETYGLMAASGVILKQTNLVGKETVWKHWWEEAIRTGHLRWALLPPALPAIGTVNPEERTSCIMPHFSVRYLASTNSSLDSVQPYGPATVEDGTVSMEGFFAGRCQVIRRLGSVILDQDGYVIRDVTLILFASGRWSLSQRMACAFGAGRYTRKQRMAIAQVLASNYHRAKLAVLNQRTRQFRPRFYNRFQAYVWSDFMKLQSVIMRIMNDAIVFLASLSNGLTSIDVVIVTAGEIPSGELWAVDFGAINKSEKTMFTVIRAPEGVTSVEELANYPQDSLPLHRIGVSSFAQVTDNMEKAVMYASHIIDRSHLQRFSIGGLRCPICREQTIHCAAPVLSRNVSALSMGTSGSLSVTKHETRLKMRRVEQTIRSDRKRKFKRSHGRLIRLLNRPVAKEHLD